MTKTNIPLRRKRKISFSCIQIPMPKLRRLFSLFRRRTKTRFTTPQTPVQTAPVQTAPPRSIRIAIFNVSMFSMSPSPKSLPPKSILKPPQTQNISNSKRRVSINLLPKDEISREKLKGKEEIFVNIVKKSVLDVLKGVDADVLALQNVRAEEEKGMKPLSELAEGLGMKFVFAESWAPQFGNAILSKWPIKECGVHRICDDDDFRNVLKATIEVPRAGEVNLHCTLLDHLDEDWRMKQVGAILKSSNGPYILAGGLNSLDETDYSKERWNDIIKYHEENGKPKPKAEVMRFLKGMNYIDAKDFAGECESVVVVAKGQEVQGTCKYGTRVDYILASPGSPYKFLPGSYGVISSKGTSDHHIVKVDLVINNNVENNHRTQKSKKRLVKIDGISSKGIWKV